MIRYFLNLFLFMFHKNINCLFFYIFIYFFGQDLNIIYTYIILLDNTLIDQLFNKMIGNIKAKYNTEI